MRRADRLFQLVQLIRGRRLSTAAQLALRLEVSERTVYRDVADLQHQDEARALVASVRMAQVWQDPVLAQASQAGRAGEFRDEAGTTLADYLRAVAPPQIQRKLMNEG